MEKTAGQEDHSRNSGASTQLAPKDPSEISLTLEKPKPKTLSKVYVFGLGELQPASHNKKKGLGDIRRVGGGGEVSSAHF